MMSLHQYPVSTVFSTTVGWRNPQAIYTVGWRNPQATY